MSRGVEEFNSGSGHFLHLEGNLVLNTLTVFLVSVGVCFSVCDGGMYLPVQTRAQSLV